MNMEQRLKEILTELACRSADVPINMLPVPFDGDLILDFGEEVVTDLKSKKEILKFEKSWVEIVEEEEERQKNLLKMESELKAMAPQIMLKEKIQEELMKEAPKKIVKLRQTFLAMEKLRKFWKTIHEELKVVLVKWDEEKIEFHHQKKIMSEVLKELQVVASREIKKRGEREERRNTIQRAMHQELMEVASRELERRNEREMRRKTIWKAIHKELMVILVKRDEEKIEFHHQKKIMSEVLKELQVVASKEIKKRSEREERRNTIQKEMHQELMAVLTRKNMERILNTKQKETMALMLKELKVVASKELKSRNERRERRETILSAIHKELMVVASKEIKKRSEREERRNTIQREMHQELMAVLTRKNMERIQNMKQKEAMVKMLKELKVVALRELKSRNEREVRRETIWKAIHKELMKFNKGTNPEDEEEDLFVPRKLFMFKVDTFKNSPQNVETTQCHKETGINNGHCTSSVGQVPTPPKKSFRGRLRKFFGLK